MWQEGQQKTTPEHLRKGAYLYVRQSTLRQVVENRESTQRQYALRQRAIALGWAEEQVVVIDSDLGRSGSSATDREGFQRLVAEVGMGRAGLVMGLEVSRLARNSSDWHRLLEICALSDTLILDEDGLYDPKSFNDRLLLGLKGTMSEAELHVLRARLRGGAMNKARRGELALRLPVGLAYDSSGRVVKNPDRQVQQSVHMLFETFVRVGSAHATAVYFRDQGLEFPLRLHCGPAKGEIHWRVLSERRVAEILHNPRYAGAYVYGRRRQRPSTVEKRGTMEYLPRERWSVLIPQAHDGYITWEQYEHNQQQLKENGCDREIKRKYTAREGPALLQGLVVCGICGIPMSVRYQVGRGGVYPKYVCKGKNNAVLLTNCQDIAGWGVDEAISGLLLEVVTPLAMEVAWAVQQELQTRIEEADRLRHKQVERARYEADLARRRYLLVDPDHRLVADELEAQWNHQLREVKSREEEYERHRESDRVVLDQEKRTRILALAGDFPRLWGDPKTPDRERKRMIRLLLEDVTLRKKESIHIEVRFKGGATRSLTIPKPLRSWEAWTTSPEVLAEIDRLLDRNTYKEIAEILNERGLKSGGRKGFSGDRVDKIIHRYGIRSRESRLRDSGWISLTEVAHKLGICKARVKIKRAAGALGIAFQKLNDMGEYMYEDPEKKSGEETKHYN